MAPSADPTQNSDYVTATESTPLLGAPESAPEINHALNGHTNGHTTKPTASSPSNVSPTEDIEEEEERPMPYLQILILCFASLAEPVAYFAIFPFINEMIFRLGDIPETSVGFYGGLIESLFSLVQMALMIPYGRAADRYGRKPVLVFSLAGISVATALFGMSQTLWQMILARCFAGCFAGSVVTVFLVETLATKKLGPNSPSSSGKPAPPPMTTWDVLKSPGVPMVLFIFGHTMLLALAYTAVSPVMEFTSIFKGGFGFSDRMIAIFLAVAGMSQAVWMLGGFPPLQRWLGTGRLLRICVAFQPFFLASFPIFNELLRHGYDRVFWIALWPSIIFSSGVAMSFACVQLALNDISPSSTVLATVNALALTVNSGVRAFAPVAFTSLFAVGVKWGWADGHLIWFVLIGIALGLNVACWFLPKAAEGNYGRGKKVGDGEEEG
ncbi:hypothetical protein LTR97_011266 [Elasticomyces elasticus]|uniref:Major facilitator superfamily (MFS) profile domain-containing protein n=1 Tax=Elasticomyces elasticus TaxID=574655 RepID=A0AAN7VT57_9PEZI|nr:hypothetical protein LTR97_011266 [Elasticomyces elasticus]